MSHPYSHLRSEHHERAHGVLERSGNKIPKHAGMPKRASGGRVNRDHPDAAEDAAMIRKAVSEHESHDHKGEPKTKLKFRDGGAVEGAQSRHHLGRRARGGKAEHKGGKHVTNVIIAPQGGGAGGPRPMGPPMAAGAPPPRPVMPPPAAAPRPAMPPPGMGAPPPGAGGPPMGARPPGMMKRGGGVQKMQEVGVPSESLMQAKKGGHVRKRQIGGPAGQGQPMGTGVAPQQAQQNARRLAMIRQAQMQGVPGGMRPAGAGVPPMGAAPAARMANQVPQQKHGGEVKVREHVRRAKGGRVPHMEAGAGGGEGRIEKMHEYGEGGFKPKKVPLHA